MFGSYTILACKKVRRDAGLAEWRLRLIFLNRPASRTFDPQSTVLM